jgi:predicted HTH transcriptional regulator
MLVYDSRGTSFTHPKIREGKKKRVCRVLSDHEYMLDRRELRTETGLTKDEVARLLDELVDEGRVVQNGLTWGVPAEQQAVET